MNIKEVVVKINQMQASGVIERYAIGGAVGATFFLEPVATLDVDVFVSFQPLPGSLLVSPQPIFDYLRAQGCAIEGEYVIISGWPVQFLPAGNPLVEDALANATETSIEEVPVRTFSAEHLAAIALQTGRAKDKSRLLQFLESEVLDLALFKSIITEHGLTEAWAKFERQFLSDHS